MIDAPVMATAAATTKGLDWNVVLRGFEALLFPAVPGAGFFAAAPGDERHIDGQMFKILDERGEMLLGKNFRRHHHAGLVTVINRH